MNAGVFLDRDDTLIKDKIYLNNPDEIEILPGAVEAVHLLNSKAIPVIIITNQSGIARGFFDEDTLHKIHTKLLSMLLSQGARIDGIYYCPHHPEGSLVAYKVSCECRKPKPGLLFKAARDFNLDLSRCYMIGDKPIDIETIHIAGGKGILLSSVKNTSIPENPEYIAQDLIKAATWILEDIFR